MKKKQFYCIKRIDDVLGSVTFLQRFKTLAEARKGAHLEHLPSKQVLKVINLIRYLLRKPCRIRLKRKDIYII